ncbi:S8 family serine peptidase [Lysobacter sp. K5869]|uniref:S8 family serine peptidase n=1 Tax=Lysobacter sp. K5869 TaxID=2820808 RepID=UPI001C05FE89|nr:S8 family serine peptidase [Lysobacter sp. K5869]QWP76005.1 S8 family serine peptidase [Lysobacter sp. K5869]
MQKMLKRSSIALGIAAVAAIAGASVMNLGGGASSAPVGGAPAPAGKAGKSVGEYERYIVVYREAPLSTYQGDVQGLPAPQRLAEVAGARGAGANGARIDVHSAAARSYVSYLDRVQASHERKIDGLLGRRMHVQHRLRHALNAVVTELTPAEAARIARLPEVSMVSPDRLLPLATDVGPQLIGAPALWNATPTGFRGEGVVVGVLDTGINFGSPSFAAVDDSGYHHINPLGAGTYLGTCAPGGVDEGRCNDKLIGGYDFVCGAPGQACDKTGIREEPGFGDTNGHGSHTASTAAGNARTANFKGRDIRISGVAPHANIVAFDVCYTTISTGQGSCPSSSSARAVDQAIADGVVDVLNFSVGGGDSPWGDPVSLAFLNATDAGIFVAAAAGNDGPGAGTMSHNEPWVSTTAAAQHGRGAFALLMQVTGPGAVPPALQAIQLVEGNSGTAFAAALPNDTPLRISAGIDTASDGCAAFPANTFQNAIAVIRRGTCSFVIKVNNAAAAGARAVLIANNAEAAISPTVTGTTIPVFGVPLSTGNAIRDFGNGSGNTATAGISYPPTPLPNTPDVLAAFSSRGPAGAYDLVKPDVTAPGVNILAVKSGTTLTGNENLVDLDSGTSMASPHQAGAAALIRQARPNWSVAEIKSALMMTAKQEIFKEDEVTPADPLSMGAGRIQIDQAIKAGLLLNETKANFLAADPAAGGNPSALNLASLGKFNCIGSCSFTRTFRNALTTRQTWSVKAQGVSALVTPSLLTLNPGESKQVKVTVSGSSLPASGAFAYGKLVLAPSGGDTAQPTLRLPIAVALQPAKLALEPAQVALSVPAGGTGSANFRIRNIGGGSLDYQIDNTGSGGRTLVVQGTNPNRRGYYATRFTDAAQAGRASLAAEDFVLSDATSITSIVANGFVIGGGALASQNLDWSIFRDVNGNPEGNSETTPNLAVWSYRASQTSAGVTVQAGTIRLNLAAAGQAANLPAGRYWLMVSARAPSATGWAWFGSLDGDGQYRLIGLDQNGAGDWEADNEHAGLAYAMQGSNACGATWVGAPNRAFGRIAGNGGYDTQVQISAAGLAPGSYSGYVCVASNDATQPKVAMPVKLTVTSAP